MDANPNLSNIKINSNVSHAKFKSYNCITSRRKHRTYFITLGKQRFIKIEKAWP